MKQTSDHSVTPVRAVGIVAGIALCIFAAVGRASAQSPHSHGSVMTTGPAGYPPAPGMMAPGAMPPPGMMHHPFPYSQPMYPQPPGTQFHSPGMRHSAVKTGEEWEPGPLEKALTAMTQGAWIRMEYLLWEIDEPGNALLGAPIAGVRNPAAYFPVVDPSTQTTIGMARVPTLSDISMRDNNGVRGTFGIPTVAGDFEGTFWTLDQARESFSAIDLPSERQNLNDPDSPLPVFVGTSTLVNGELGTNIELYDESFTASYMSKVWGAEAKFVFDTGYPDDWFTLKPMIGFHHLNIQEELRQTGVFSGRTSDQPLLQPLVSEIDSDTTNHLYGALLGARLEFVHPWITLGLEPKVTLGADRYKARVRTNNFRSLQDGEVITEVSDTTFSPVVELAVYLRLKVHERAEFHVGYNVLWAARITRPHDNIRYNDNGSFPEPPGVVVDAKHDDFTLEGLTLGGVIYLH